MENSLSSTQTGKEIPHPGDSLDQHDLAATSPKTRHTSNKNTNTSAASIGAHFLSRGVRFGQIKPQDLSATSYLTIPVSRPRPQGHTAPARRQEKLRAAPLQNRQHFHEEGQQHLQEQGSKDLLALKFPHLSAYP